VFADRFTNGGGQILETIKVPLANPDFAPFLQRARDLHPDTLFVFVPANGQSGIFARQFVERGLDKAGIKLIGTGDLTDDEDLAGINDLGRRQTYCGQLYPRGALCAKPQGRSYRPIAWLAQRQRSRLSRRRSSAAR
jgi:hypothetical protein